MNIVDFKCTLNWEGLKDPKTNLLSLATAAELNNKTELDNNNMKKSNCNTIIDFSRRQGDRVNVINNDNEATI